MRNLYIACRSSEKAALLYEDNKLVEVFFDRELDRSQVDHIYLGKVVNIEKGLQAAFIDIGTGKNGFLRQQDIGNQGERIESLLTIGQYIIVQVKKDGIGEKGPLLTADITIAGSYSVYLPKRGRVSVSHKIQKDEQSNLKEIITPMLEKEEGVIVRTAAKHLDSSSIRNELSFLRDKWRQAKGRIDRKKPGMIMESRLVPDGVFKKYPIHLIDECVVDDASLSKQIKSMYPLYSDRIKWVKHWNKNKGYSINECQEKLVQRTVGAAKGVNLTIDETEAMNVIDVNSHAFTGRSDKEQTAYQANVASVNEIARQIRLRNLSGIVMIDFINTGSRKNNADIERALKQAMKDDPVPTVCHGFTKLGLYEITRKRENASWSSKLVENVTSHKKRSTVLFQMDRDILALEDSSHEAILVAVSHELDQLKKQLLSTSVSSKIPQEVFFRVDPVLHNYTIEMAGSLDTVREFVASRGYHVDKSF
ncbi:ribonuclease E/G [Thalassobacillus devorans]|uniref:ribonuclease E/G n=1 Tax=Thalassobacillus devorans TaxID=279813 RepID=UPI000A1CD76D|nr:ribonuclease E/G [Thalassobacillus devorans]